MILEINVHFSCACVPNTEIDGEYGFVNMKMEFGLKENIFGQVEYYGGAIMIIHRDDDG